MTARRMSKQERVEARRQFQEEREHRKRLEAQIAELEKLRVDVQPEETLGLTVAPMSPALDFIRRRLNKVPPDDPQSDAKWQQAVIDLVASNIPLDPRTRSLLAGELSRLYFPNAERDRRARRRIESAAIEDLKRELLRRGMTAAEVEREVAQTFGISVPALRKRTQRAAD
jgi:hypothetical protein